MLDNHVPVYLVSFQTQEIVLFRHVKTGEPLVGHADRVETVSYAGVFGRFEEELDDEVTGGWKLLEVRNLCSSSALGFLVETCLALVADNPIRLLVAFHRWLDEERHCRSLLFLPAFVVIKHTPSHTQCT